MATFITTAVRTSNPTSPILLETLPMLNCYLSFQ
jgi:hypothetical protein